MPHIPKSVRNSAILLALYYGVVAAAIMLFASPLFRVLSFEYSSLIALFGSLPVMWFAAGYTLEHKSEPIIGVLGKVWLALVPSILLPVLISLVFVRSCDLWHGLAYYAHIVMPSTMTATLFGAFCAIAVSPRRRVIDVILLWVLTFLLSLLPGYLSTQIFTYGWQYGYFPGFVWDEYIELGFRYDLAVFGYMFVAALLVFFWITKSERATYKKTKKDPPLRFWIMHTIFALLTFEGIVHGYAFFGWLSHGAVEEKLDKTLLTGNITIHHTAEFSREKATILKHDIHRYLQEIDSLFPGIDTTIGIDIYLYTKTEDLHRFVGTRRASIAKPWLGTLHIAEENLSSLKHELVHLLLKPFGNFPIYASWSTGLTEGAAVASEADYDGLRTVDELSAWALKMQYAHGVTPLMMFTGFAGAASSASYILTGSFSKYLLAKYGSEKYLTLYTTRDYESVYGKTLETLDAEWRNMLLPTYPVMSSTDSLIARYYFDRTSVVNQACLRRIGRLLHEANDAYEDEQYSEAYELYRQAYSEDPARLDAVRGMVMAKLRQKQFQFYDAAAILDSGTIMHKPNGKVLLSSLRGDVHFLAFGNKDEMKRHYEDAIKYAPNDARYASAVGIRMIIEDSIFNVRKFLYFRYGLDSSMIPQALYEHAWESEMPDSVRIGYLLLRTLFNENRGEYSAAVHEWTALPAFVDPEKLSPRVRKAYDIIDRKVSLWIKALDLY